ncbi:MAG: hypothetical protein RMZ69_31810 [Nostoc sp. ChiQUE01a]|nr:hypothetical protein [Nostoc sp. ChiQUE01a]
MSKTFTPSGIFHPLPEVRNTVYTLLFLKDFQIAFVGIQPRYNRGKCPELAAI